MVRLLGWIGALHALRCAVRDARRFHRLCRLTRQLLRHLDGRSLVELGQARWEPAR